MCSVDSDCTKSLCNAVGNGYNSPLCYMLTGQCYCIDNNGPCGNFPG